MAEDVSGGRGQALDADPDRRVLRRGDAAGCPPASPGGPFALATSARSDVLQEFEGGPGQIAMHGRDNLGGTLGTAASHGCVRLGTASIDWLAERIGPGMPVTISAD